MPIPIYTDFDDKQKHFRARHQIINKKEDFYFLYKDIKNFVQFKEHHGASKFVFRGVCDASFKNYTSAQREYLLLDGRPRTSFKAFICAEIDALKGNKVYQHFLEEQELRNNDWHALSFLQHFGGDSICLDFSYDLDKALFFMTVGAEPVSSDNRDLDDYMSLYYMRYPAEFDIANINDNDAQRGNKMVADARNQDSTLSIDTGLVAQNLTEQKFEEYFDAMHDKQEPFLAIDKENRILNAFYLGINQVLLSIENPNILAQDGCFAVILNENTPYEHEDLYCVDIHRSIVGYIAHILASKGITQDKIYTKADNYQEAAREAKAQACQLLKQHV